MSKNLSSLARRKGTTDSLFETLVDTKPSAKDSTRKALAKNHLVGESTVKGTASFYDFLEGKNADKKAYVCNGSSCLCAETQDRVQNELEKHFNSDDIGHITCLGLCNKNSSFRVDGVNYSGKDIERLADILGKPPQHEVDPLYVECLASEAILTTPVTDITSYYHLFTDVTDKYSGEQLLQQISDSGLRGRGGAGFPTGFKWSACRNEPGHEKYIVCNADEGDPGAFSDRYLLEQNPHSVLFGMLMAGWLTGAREGILYIRDEYPESISVCEQAIKDLESQQKLLADSQISKDDWSFKFKVIKGAGAYICGEETALLRSIEGQRPVVSVRPPFPTQSGLYGLPTALNNVETFASIHWILTHGADAFKAIGNGRSTGTKLLSLDSSFNKPGIYEVDMGTPLQTVIEASGGFCLSIKAMHIGGPLGGIVPRSHFDQLNLDFESFNDAGFLLGHASIIGIPETMPMVKYLQHLFEFTAVESCGKCFPCRLGATRGEEMLSSAMKGEGKIDRELFDDLLETMKLGSLCALGGGVPLPVENALEYFANELKPFFKADESIDIREIR